MATPNQPFNANEIAVAISAYVAGSLPLNLLFANLGGAANSQASFGSQQDNLALTSQSFFQRWTASVGVNVTGIVAPTVDGVPLLIVNIGTNNITLKNLVTSTAANQFQNTTGADIVLSQNQMAFAIYDLTTAKWRVSKLN